MSTTKKWPTPTTKEPEVEDLMEQANDGVCEAADVDAGREGRRIGVEVQTRDYDRDSVASCDQSNYCVDGAGEAYVLRHPEIIELD